MDRGINSDKKNKKITANSMINTHHCSIIALVDIKHITPLFDCKILPLGVENRNTFSVENFDHSPSN